MTHPFEDMMRSQDPARGFSAYSRADRDQLVDAVATTPTRPAQQPSRSRPWARGVSIAAAAALALMLLLVPVLGDHGATTAEALDRLAHAVTGNPIPKGKYELIATTSTGLDSLSGRRITDSRRTWRATDGWAWAQRTGSREEYYLSAPVAYPDNPDSSTVDPAAIVEFLRARVQGSSSVEEAIFVAIQTHLRDNAVPVELRAAEIRALGLVAGVTVTEGATDPTGRLAIKATFIDQTDRPGMEQTTYFNPTDSQVLAEEWILNGERVSSLIVTERRIVDSIPAKVTDMLGTAHETHSISVMPDGSLEHRKTFNE